MAIIIEWSVNEEPFSWLGLWPCLGGRDPYEDLSQEEAKSLNPHGNVSGRDTHIHERRPQYRDWIWSRAITTRSPKRAKKRWKCHITIELSSNVSGRYVLGDPRGSYSWLTAQRAVTRGYVPQSSDHSDLDCLIWMP